MTEKFDIIEKVVYRYDSEMEQQKEIELLKQDQIKKQ